MKRHTAFFLLLTIVSAVWVVSSVWGAQVGALAQVSGTVYNERREVVPRSLVELKNLQTGLMRSTQSNEAGFYVLEVPAGIYELKVEQQGFKTFRQRIELTVGQRITLDIELRVGAIEEMMEVVAEAPVVERTRVEQSQVLGNLQITHLPISGRRFLDFALLTPNVSVGRSYVGSSLAPVIEPQAVKISFGGLREFYSNNIRIDGADATSGYTGVQRLTPSQQATAEFRVLAGAYAAEYGRASGGVVSIITKSGTNELHGEAYYFLRNDALDARTILRPPALDVLRQHQFGFTLGGPIVRDRVFYFGNYEGQRRAESPIYSTFILNNLPAINQVLQYFSIPPERLDVLKTNNADQVLIRLDRTGEKLTLSGRYELAEQRNTNQPGTVEGFGTPSTFRHNDLRDQTVVANVIWLPSGALTSETLFQFARRSFHNPSVAFPTLSIPNVLSTGFSGGAWTFYREHRVQFANTWSLVRGKHIAKFGMDLNYLRDHVLYPGLIHGSALFSPASFFGLPPFQEPTALFVIMAVPRAVRGEPLPQRVWGSGSHFPDPRWERAMTIFPRWTFFEVFGQDQVRVLRDRLTLNFGIRYGFETRPYGVVKDDWNNIQPRVGFTYALTDRTLIRGGGGIYVSPMYWSDVLGYLTPWGAERLPDPHEPLTPVPYQTGHLALAGPPAGPGFLRFARTGTYPPIAEMFHYGLIVPEWDIPNPYAEHAILQLERQLGQTWGITIGYLFVHGLKITALRLLNLQEVGRLPNGKRLFAPRFPGFLLYQNIEPRVKSSHHAGNLIVQKRWGHGFTLAANYTFSKTIDDSTPSVGFIQNAEDSFDLRLDRALSSMHVAHRLVLNVVAEGPRRFRLTRDFRLAVITVLESPRFYTLFAGFDVNGDMQPSTDRVGVLGRNTLEGDGFSSVDLRLSREIRVGERVRVETIAEVFNLFNTVNITDFDTVYGAADFLPGQPVVRKYTDRLIIPAPNPGFLTPRSVGPARQIQFALRVRF
jgi:hypothetical protein